MTDAPANAPKGKVRTRFAPSPSGDLHVGNIRTALYSWAYARHNAGEFVFRIEDTDRSRVTDEAIASAAETLRWLGLDWDEGVEKGGPYAPYLQSERLDLYREWADRLLDNGSAYRCFCTQEELDAERKAQQAAKQPPGYSGKCRSLTAGQIEAYEKEGRTSVVRFRMPEGETVFHDTARGDVHFDNSTIPDFVILRANGIPLYNLAVSVDDITMKLTHIIRGDDLISSTPKQIALYRAMGVAEEDVPVFTHLPWVLSSDGKPLSKRYDSASIKWYRDQGYLPEAVVNYLALLGWSPGDDREDFTLAQLAEWFDVERVVTTAARFDEKKLDAINGNKIRALSPEEFVQRVLPFVESGRAGSPDTEEVVRSAAPLIQERIARLTEADGLLRFLLVDEEDFTVEAASAAKILTEDARPVLESALGALEELGDWTHEVIESALRKALIDDLGLKPKHAFGPVRVATTGSRISPPLFESLELLGRDRTLSRIRRALSEHIGV